MPVPREPARSESGVALILVLIFTVLLYAIVADLVTTARTARLTGENEALIAQVAELSEASAAVEIEGARYPDEFMKMSGR